MPITKDTMVKGQAFADATGLQSGENLEDLTTEATLTDGSELLDQASLETYLDVDIYRARIAALGVTNAMLGGGIDKSKLLEEYLKFSYALASGNNGGSSAATTWTVVPINTEDSDTDTLGSLAADQITLAAGTYRCLISVPFFDTGVCKARLRNTTGAATLLVGGNITASSVGNTFGRSVVAGRFTVAGGQALEVQYYCTEAHVNSGLGEAAASGENEVYTVAEFWRVG